MELTSKTEAPPIAPRTAGGDHERAGLVDEIAQMQSEFEHRALAAVAGPLMSTPLTMQQLKVLTMIALDPQRATGRDLADLLDVSVASISGIVDRLAEHGMIERTEDPHDRRVRRLTVSDRGGEIIRGLLSNAGTIPTPVLMRIPLDDLRALVRGVRAMNVASRELEDELSAGLR